MYIETERLIIRPFEPSDLPEFTRLLDIKEVPYWGQQKERAEEFLNWQISNYAKMDIVAGVVCFGIFNKKTAKVLGFAGAGEHDDLHETEIFYSLLEEARGYGYATEAARAVTDWVMENYKPDYIIGTADVQNIASQKVLERCGYKFISEQNLLVHVEGKRYDFKYYRYYPAFGS